MIEIHDADKHALFPHRFITDTEGNEYVVCAICGHWTGRRMDETCNCVVSCHAQARETSPRIGLVFTDLGNQMDMPVTSITILCPSGKEVKVEAITIDDDINIVIRGININSNNIDAILLKREEVYAVKEALNQILR
jgi:hypothetical protein